MKARWNDTRKITQRWVIKGTLKLLTPARFGGGKAAQTTDMPILRNPADRKPLLPGASIAGAMRAYLNERLQGYENGESALAEQLFGHVTKDKSNESFLAVEDACADISKVEFRPGVKIDPKTRTAAREEKNKRGQLFDAELLQPDTTFELCFELDLPENAEEQAKMKEALAIALSGFEAGEIGLGARKRRGFGECKVENWQVEKYDLKNKTHLLAWLQRQPGEVQKGGTIAQKLGITGDLPDKRRRFCMDASFLLETSLLIRYASTDPNAPDMVHLRNGKGAPILSGTSLAGALRARAHRIARTYNDEQKALDLVQQVFGPAEIKPLRERHKGDEPFASRAVIHEREVKGKNDLVQTRIKIDRFTGGTFPGALFEQQPLIGGKNSLVNVHVELRNPTDAHIGLLLNLLKDLWTGDLPLGGEASVGRGRLKGCQATLEMHDPLREKPHQHWIIKQVVDQEGKIQKALQVEGDSLQDLAGFAPGGKQ